MDNYEISDETMAIIPIDCYKTKILEKNREYVIEKKAYNIMEDNCKYYGSTYVGRINAAKDILNCAYKLPIIVEESNSLIFFPTKSSLENDCCWINFNFVENIEKFDKKSKIYFNNNKELIFDSSKISIENQLLRSTRLGYIINQRLNRIKNN